MSSSLPVTRRPRAGAPRPGSGGAPVWVTRAGDSLWSVARDSAPEPLSLRQTARQADAIMAHNRRLLRGRASGLPAGLRLVLPPAGLEP